MFVNYSNDRYDRVAIKLPRGIASHVSAVVASVLVQILLFVRKLNVSPFATSIFQHANLHPPNSHFDHLRKLRLVWKKIVKMQMRIKRHYSL